MYTSSFPFFHTKNLKMIKIGDKKYLEIKEFAKNKGVTVQTVYNWIKDNRVESKKMMGKIIVRL